MEYSRMGPTPWVRTSHPSTVSTGEPQLPVCVSSHGRLGTHGVRGSPHQHPSVEVATALFSRSRRTGRRIAPRPCGGRRPSPCSSRPVRRAGTSGTGGSRWSRSSGVRCCRWLGRSGAVIGGETDEAGVLHAPRLRRTVGPEDTLGDRGPRRELDPVAASGDAPGQLLGVGAAVPGDPLAGQRRDGPLELHLVEAGGRRPTRNDARSASEPSSRASRRTAPDRSRPG
jgi:hypothetical protein